MRFYNSKVRLEQLVPLSAKGVSAVKAQQQLVLDIWPKGSPWLFPGVRDNPDGPLPYDYHSFGRRLRAWQRAINLHDEKGRPVTAQVQGVVATLSCWTERR